MAKKLTATTVAHLKADPSKRLEVPDAGAPGLYLVIQPSGARSWAFRYRFADKPKKLTLGTVNDRDAAAEVPIIGGHLTLGDARRIASDCRHQLALGKDPASKAQERKKAGPDTFPGVVRQFITLHAEAKGLKTAGAIARSLEVDAVPSWRSKRIDEVTKADLISLIEKKAETAPTQANRLLAHLRKLFNWAVARDLIATSPAAGVKAPSREVSRDRVLADLELIALWKATKRVGYPFGSMVRLLLLTAQRLSEVAEMGLGEIDLSGKVWTIPKERTKNGIEQTVPMTDRMLAMIDELPRIGNGRFLFTTTGHSPVSGFGKAKAAIDREMTAILFPGDEKAELPHWQFHDLRRTAATIMARKGVAIHVVEAILNHSSGTISGVAAIYNRHKYFDEKRAALNILDSEIKKICGRAR